jgi:hypothetical protein
VGVLGLLWCGTVAAGSGDVNLILGERVADEELFEENDVDRQPQLGVAVTLDLGPVALAIDLLSSSEDATQSLPSELPRTVETEVGTLELDVGVRKHWGTKNRVYVGGGFAYLRLDAKQTDSGTLVPDIDYTYTVLDDSGDGFGLWLNAGYLYRFGEHFNVGVDVRFSDAEVDLAPPGGGESITLGAGGLQYGLQVGYHW